MSRNTLLALLLVFLMPFGGFWLGASLGVEHEAELHEVEGDGRSSRQTLAASLLWYERYVSCAVPPESKTWVCDEDTVLVRPLNKNASLKLAKLAAWLPVWFERLVGIMMIFSMTIFIIITRWMSERATETSPEPQAN